MSDRELTPEEMDDPTLAAEEHFHALDAFPRINFLSRTAAILWASIQAFVRQTGARSLRVLDVATGAGDIPTQLSKQSRRNGLFLEVDGCDKSPDAIDYAHRRAEVKGVRVRFFVHDVIHDGIPSGYDILINSLFLHHLESTEALDFLRCMSLQANKMVLISDLLRSPAGLAFAYIGSRTLSRSPIVHADSLRSVRAAFNVNEASELAGNAGLKNFSIKPYFPGRFLLTWKQQKQ